MMCGSAFRAALVVAVWMSVSAAMLRPPAAATDREPTSRRPIRQQLQNDDDVSFIGKIQVGGQTMAVIPDTGSFEIVLFSDQCTSCGMLDALYHANASSTVRHGPLQAKQSYGSGATMSQEAYDDVSVESMLVKGQMFWEVRSADMPILSASTFQGIFGLGPPSSNSQMTLEEFTRGKAEVEQLKKDGMDTSPYEPALKNLHDVYEFSKTEGLWLTALAMRSFSICLVPGSREPGFMIYDDDSVDRHPTQFTSVHSIGKMYWSTKLTQVTLGSDTLDCERRECTAIMDTGTSLIAAPSDVVDELERKFNEQSGICDNLSVLPHLEFVLDGKQLSLPPEAYVGTIEGELPDSALDLIPSLRHQRDMHRERSTETCSLLLMRMDVQSDGPREWIFGLPFFRQYYTTFRLHPDSRAAESMHFAKANKLCEIGEPSNLRVPQGLDHGTAPLRIAAHKLRPPRRWSQRKQMK